MLVLLDRLGRAKETVQTIVDRIDSELGRVGFLFRLPRNSRRARVEAATEQLDAFAKPTSLGGRVAFGRRDETVALEACEGSYRLVVDLVEDRELRRTLRMCGIAYVVGPHGLTQFADGMRRRPRLLPRPLDEDWPRAATAVTG